MEGVHNYDEFADFNFETDQELDILMGGPMTHYYDPI